MLDANALQAVANSQSVPPNGEAQFREGMSLKHRERLPKEQQPFCRTLLTVCRRPARGACDSWRGVRLLGLVDFYFSHRC